MEYDPKKVAELIANRKEDELAKDIQPRLWQIAKIFSKIKYGLDIENTVGRDFAIYIRSGAYSRKSEFSFDGISYHSLTFWYRIYACDGEYNGYGNITIPIEFATCEDKDLKGVVITQIRDDLYRYANKLEKEFNKARNIRNKFTIEYDRFINTKEKKDTSKG